MGYSVESMKGLRIKNILRSEKFYVFIGLVLLISLAWFNVFQISSTMLSAADMMIAGVNYYSLAVMWMIMMMGMMLPSAIPMILIFAALKKKREAQGKLIASTWIFISGYVMIWLAFSLLAAYVQYLLRSFLLLSNELYVINPYISGTILIAAGAYQLTKIKNVCLKNCQSPLDFITSHWREGNAGALLIGLRHGIYCLGCCWLLMGLLFVGGIMNLLLVIAIASFIFIEKLVPVRWISYLAGLILIFSGIIIFARFVI